MDKTTVSRAFNNMLNEFLVEILKIVPDNIDIKKTQIYFNTIKSVNPALVIKLWYKYIYVPYSDKIAANDITFFIEKDYVEDVHNLEDSNQVMKSIDKLREPIRNMTTEDKATSMVYLEKLSQLSFLNNGL